MATNAIPANLDAYEAEIPFRGSIVTSVPRIEPTVDADLDDGCGAAQGILIGLLLCAPFWVGILAMLF
jgi:hypothetical protein